MNQKNVGRRGHGLTGDNIAELQGTTDNHAREDRRYSGQSVNLRPLNTRERYILDLNFDICLIFGTKKKI
jgi:hypothetical protein